MSATSTIAMTAPAANVSFLLEELLSIVHQELEEVTIYRLLDTILERDDAIELYKLITLMAPANMVDREYVFVATRDIKLCAHILRSYEYLDIHGILDVLLPNHDDQMAKVKIDMILEEQLRKDDTDRAQLACLKS